MVSEIDRKDTNRAEDVWEEYLIFVTLQKDSVTVTDMINNNNLHYGTWDLKLKETKIVFRNILLRCLQFLGPMFNLKCAHL